jgi:hypothetical protein
MGNFEPLPWALGMSKKFDLNGNELAITSLLDINNKKYMSKIFFSIISESARLLLLKNIRKIDIFENNLTFVENGIFLKNEKLFEITFNQNQIFAIGPKAFH